LFHPKQAKNIFAKKWIKRQLPQRGGGRDKVCIGCLDSKPLTFADGNA
jgi:hypothetical protein